MPWRFSGFRAADVRSIVAVGAGTPQPRPAGDALILDLPTAPTRSLVAYVVRPSSVTGSCRHDWHRTQAVTVCILKTAAPQQVPDLAADLDAGLRRLKLAAIRRTAPEVPLTAKTQRWTPEEVLRTLIVSEIAARDASNIVNRLQTAAFAMTKTLESFDVAASSIQPDVFDYLSSLEWVRTQSNLALIGPARTGKSHPLIGLGVAALYAGHEVRYFTAADLVETLHRGLADNTVGKIIDSLLLVDPIIVDLCRPRIGPRWDSRGSTTPERSCSSGLSPAPTNGGRWRSPRTGRSSSGVGSCPGTPPQHPSSTDC